MVTTSPESTAPAQAGEAGFATAELELGGMHCSACATRIERALGQATGRGQRLGEPGHHSGLRLLRPRRSTPTSCAGPSPTSATRPPRPCDARGPTADRPRSLGDAGRHLVAPGPGRAAVVRCSPPRRRGGLDGARPGHRRGVGRRLALPPRRRPAAPPRRHQHGHPHRPGTLAALAVERRRGHRPRGRHLHLGGSGASPPGSTGRWHRSSWPSW